MQILSKMRIVWQNACTRNILQHGFPCPSFDEETDAPQLELHTIHAYNLARKWMTGSSRPSDVITFDSAASTFVSDIRFVPGHDGKWILVVSRGIWSVLSLWNVEESGSVEMICQWGPRGNLFIGLAVNTDPHSEATLAVSIAQNRSAFLYCICQHVPIDADTSAFNASRFYLSAKRIPHSDLFPL